MVRTFITFLLIISTSFAQDKKEEEKEKDPLAGHSYHGEAFNEGPRQSAYLMGGTGNVDFEITTKSDLAHKFFLQGVGQIHGFWYFEAERSFRQAAVHDPKCAMAYWGMAQANTSNQKRALEFLSKAYEHIEGVSEREKMWIDSYAARLGLPTDEKGLEAYRKDKKKFKPKRSDKDRRGDYVKKLEEIVLKYPKDLEAKAFLVVTLYLNARGGHPINSHVAVNSLAMEVIREKPLHPTHHFIIHLWDRKKPEIALDSASKCGQGSPSVAHMWHMPGHIYSRLHRFADAAWQQEASARTDHRHMMNDLVLPDQIHNFAHNNEWLCRNLINLGRVHDALSLSKNMSELPRHPKYNNLGKRGSTNYGRQRLFQCLNTFEMWEESIRLKDSIYLEPTDINKEKVKRLRLLGRAYYNQGDIVNGDKVSAELTELYAQIKRKAIKDHEDKQKKAAEAAKKKPVKKEVAKKGAKKPVKKDAKPKKRPVSKDEELAEDALFEMKLVKAMTQGKTAEVIKERKDLNGLDEWVKVRAYIATKDFKKALEITQKSVDSNKNKVVNLARHVYTLFQSGDKKKAKENFDYLRTISEYVDLGALPFIRLTEAAAEFGYPENWCLQNKKYDDVGNRPELSSLGPFRWQPVKSPDFELPNSEGEMVSLKSLNKNQPVLLIFYLGAGCLHCVEQLNAFAPMKAKFEKAGIKLIAVSTETVKELKSSVDSYSDNKKFPFPIYANKELDVFKKFRCYDDFEKMALHGTFLIDRNGFIRWQDISYEPFMKPDFLLKESQRLLGQPEELIYGKKLPELLGI